MARGRTVGGAWQRTERTIYSAWEIKRKVCVV